MLNDNTSAGSVEKGKGEGQKQQQVQRAQEEGEKKQFARTANYDINHKENI
jgi:hypothetical protein